MTLGRESLPISISVADVDIYKKEYAAAPIQSFILGFSFFRRADSSDCEFDATNEDKLIKQANGSLEALKLQLCSAPDEKILYSKYLLNLVQKINVINAEDMGNDVRVIAQMDSKKFVLLRRNTLNGVNTPEEIIEENIENFCGIKILNTAKELVPLAIDIREELVSLFNEDQIALLPIAIEIGQDKKVILHEQKEKIREFFTKEGGLKEELMHLYAIDSAIERSQENVAAQQDWLLDRDGMMSDIDDIANELIGEFVITRENEQQRRGIKRDNSDDDDKIGKAIKSDSVEQRQYSNEIIEAVGEYPIALQGKNGDVGTVLTAVTVVGSEPLMPMAIDI